MSDVANKVFSRFDRPVVIVRDDKIEYANKTFMSLLEVKSEAELLHEKFLKLVVRDDWNFLAENIGAMLTNNEAATIRLLGANHKVLKVKFEAMYLSDNQHFTFILMGEPVVPKAVTAMSMYDSVTGLPNFYLFEDRVQTAVNYENHKDVRQRKNMIAVAGVSIDNFAALKNIGLHDLVLRKLAERLMLSLKKIYTAASGLKFQFWVLLPDVADEESLKVELQKIQNILSEPVADNFTKHDISASIGVSIILNQPVRQKIDRAGNYGCSESPKRGWSADAGVRGLIGCVEEAAPFTQNLKSLFRVSSVRGVDCQSGQNGGRRFAVFFSNYHNAFGVLSGF